MTGRPTLLIELDDGTGTFPYDVTAWVNLKAGWSLERGRRDEFADIDPAVFRLQFDNTDGRFTLGSPTYGIRVDHPIRLTETFGSTTSVRHTGFVQDWPTMWDSPTAVRAVMRVTSVDWQSRLQRREMENALKSSILLDVPAALWPMQEESKNTQYASATDPAAPRLTRTGSGLAPVLGYPVEDESGEIVSGARFRGGRFFEIDERFAFPATAYTLEVYGTFPTLPTADQVILAIGPDMQRYGVFLEPSGIIRLGLTGTGGPVIVDELVHHIVIETVISTQVRTLWVDGVVADTDVATVGSGPLLIEFGGPSSAPVSAEVLNEGVLAFAAYYDSAVGSVIADRPTSGQPPESSDARITRILALGEATGTTDLEPGILTNVPAQNLTGAKVWSAIQDVATAEGGAVFMDGSGALVLQNRTHRTLAAAGDPVVTLAATDIDTDVVISADKQYLQNKVDGSRLGGSTLPAVVNQDSIDLYDQYPESLNSLLVTTDTEVLDRINWQVGAYSTPMPRMSSVTIDLLTLDDDAKVEALLALELGDRILITDLPPQSPISQGDLIVEGIREDQSVTEWKLTLNTVSASLFRAWVLGDATDGVLGSTTRLHY